MCIHEHFSFNLETMLLEFCSNTNLYTLFLKLTLSLWLSMNAQKWKAKAAAKIEAVAGKRHCPLFTGSGVAVTTSATVTQSFSLLFSFGATWECHCKSREEPQASWCHHLPSITQKTRWNLSPKIRRRSKEKHIRSASIISLSAGKVRGKENSKNIILGHFIECLTSTWSHWRRSSAAMG